MQTREMVPVTGLEPVRYCYRGILSPLCLPFHHTGRKKSGDPDENRTRVTAVKGRCLNLLTTGPGSAGTIAPT